MSAIGEREAGDVAMAAVGASGAARRRRERRLRSMGGGVRGDVGAGRARDHLASFLRPS